MKTLDEVIKAYEICHFDDKTDCSKCPYDDDCYKQPGEELENDTHEYLKEYRELLANAEANEPLEFITICGMVGKPVWIEYDNQSVALLSPPKRWAIVCTVDDDWNEISFCGKGNPFWLRADDFGIHWKAYRKERKCFS